MINAVANVVNDRFSAFVALAFFGASVITGIVAPVSVESYQVFWVGNVYFTVESIIKITTFLMGMIMSLHALKVDSAIWKMIKGGGGLIKRGFKSIKARYRAKKQKDDIDLFLDRMGSGTVHRGEERRH